VGKNLSWEKKRVTMSQAEVCTECEITAGASGPWRQTNFGTHLWRISEPIRPAFMARQENSTLDQ